eukprot:GHVP01035197.1.p1 GENE.GHVP01035197.1~~GHVP01035197.1.p1  ORF type:complete len:220 (+),score=41.61 GHVP01035197.1:133-792(+)
MDFELLKLPLDQLNSAVILPNFGIPGDENEATERGLFTAELTFHGASLSSLSKTKTDVSCLCNQREDLEEIKNLVKKAFGEEIDISGDGRYLFHFKSSKKAGVFKVQENSTGFIAEFDVAPATDGSKKSARNALIAKIQKVKSSATPQDVLANSNSSDDEDDSPPDYSEHLLLSPPPYNLTNSPPAYSLHPTSSTFTTATPPPTIYDPNIHGHSTASYL